jgi:hypothetical protein
VSGLTWSPPLLAHRPAGSSKPFRVLDRRSPPERCSRARPRPAATLSGEHCRIPGTRSTRTPPRRLLLAHRHSRPVPARQSPSASTGAAPSERSARRRVHLARERSRREQRLERQPAPTVPRTQPEPASTIPTSRFRLRFHDNDRRMTAAAEGIVVRRRMPFESARQMLQNSEAQATDRTSTTRGWSVVSSSPLRSSNSCRSVSVLFPQS